MKNRKALNHSQPSNREVAGDLAVLTIAVVTGAAVGMGLYAKQLAGRALRRLR